MRKKKWILPWPNSIYFFEWLAYQKQQQKPKINRNQSDLFKFDEMKQLFMYINILRTYPVIALKQSLFQNCILDVAGCIYVCIWFGVIIRHVDRHSIINLSCFCFFVVLFIMYFHFLSWFVLIQHSKWPPIKKRK